MDAVTGRWLWIGGGWLATVLLAAVFAYAGVVKVIDPVGFYGSVLDYRLVGGGLAVAASVLLPVFEIVVAAGLFIPRWARAARAWIVWLLLVFLVAILQAWWRGIDLSCGCFGGGEPVAPWSLILRDLALLGLAAMARLPGGVEGKTMIQCGMKTRVAGGTE